ncbi:MAG: (S)-ureidoglycine aminohydrolase [Pirellulales bacterium]|nr:(S)-ureidoglycine aminohydrolase [Pirellulales bacterium]
MNLYGHTRSRIAANHALITPDTHVWGPLPGWKGATAAVHISPHLGARFMQASVALETGGMSGGAGDGLERVIFVRSGAVSIKLPGGGPAQRLGAEGFAYFPADRPHEIKATEPTNLVVFEKPFQKAPGVELPEAVIGVAGDVPGEPFLGDDDARLQVLLPADERFDLAVNLFTYQPGATLPQVEIHIMEHGLIMLDGAGVYRLGDSWYPVEAGDVIWMGSYCPQWFVAMGKTPARYLYYKDVNRGAL